MKEVAEAETKSNMKAKEDAILIYKHKTLKLAVKMRVTICTYVHECEYVRISIAGTALVALKCSKKAKKMSALESTYTKSGLEEAIL